ncbi:unnamed protein product [Prorocentrum cordatum]|uniref:Uncharacterized protein n=1 Tax=Prorocentrum cordatum TaxID=2364126 RepID=A0ABN9QYT1_9DINO|nr:unnamed protein product [Polarella glacialis]
MTLSILMKRERTLLARIDANSCWRRPLPSESFDAEQQMPKASINASVPPDLQTARGRIITLRHHRVEGGRGDRREKGREEETVRGVRIRRESAPSDPHRVSGKSTRRRADLQPRWNSPEHRGTCPLPPPPPPLLLEGPRREGKMHTSERGPPRRARPSLGAAGARARVSSG